MYDMEDLIVPLIGEGRGGVNRSHHCPFHRDRRASFSINMNEGLWICFSCGERGNYEKLCRMLDQIPDFDYKVRKALQDAAREPEESRDFTRKADSLFRAGERNKRHILSFLDSRGISERAIARFSLGWSVERQAISFPYPDRDGRVRGIKYRLRDGSKRAEDYGHFGLYHPELAIGRDAVAIFEGESDTLAGWTQLGDAVGICGTSGASLSTAQWDRFAIDLLFARRIYLCYDADSAGDDCSKTAMQVLGDKCIRVRPTRGNDISEHLMNGGTLKEIGLDE